MLPTHRVHVSVYHGMKIECTCCRAAGLAQDPILIIMELNVCRAKAATSHIGGVIEPRGRLASLVVPKLAPCECRPKRLFASYIFDSHLQL